MGCGCYDVMCDAPDLGPLASRQAKLQMAFPVLFVVFFFVLLEGGEEGRGVLYSGCRE